MANKRSPSQKDDKIRELENEILANKEKIRMNSQLTQALSDSVKREEQLKKQCDQLLESLHSALGEDEKLAAKITELEDHIEYLQNLINEKDKEINSLQGVQKSPSKSKKSDLATFIETDLESGGVRWKQLKYSHLEGLSDKENFDLLRKVMEYKDSHQESEKYKEHEAIRSVMISKNLSSNLEEILKERENDIKDLLKDYEKLQFQYKDLEQQKSYMEQELLQLREKLAVKSNQLVNMYESQDHFSQIPEEFNSLRKQYLEIINTNQVLQSQLAVINSKANLFRDEILDNLDPADSDYAHKIVEVYKNSIANEIQNLESSMVKELRSHIDDLQDRNLEFTISNESLRIEASALRSLLDEEKRAEKDAKSSKNDWKKFKRDHVARIEKIYQEQLTELKNMLAKFNATYKEKEKKIVDLSKYYENEIKELTFTLKKEHESKKKITEIFAKEKENSDKTKETMLQFKATEENLVKKYTEAKSALEDSNKKIFRLEQELKKQEGLEESFVAKSKNFEKAVEELENSKARLCSEITRLNKHIQENEMEKRNLELEKQSNLFFCEETKANQNKEIRARDEKIEDLLRENSRIKKEVFENDFRIKTLENEIEKQQGLKQNYVEVQKQLSLYESSIREKQYIESENKSLREDLKGSQVLIQQLKAELRKISAETIDLQNELTLASSKKFQDSLKDTQVSKENQYQEEIFSMKTRLSSISKDFQQVKGEYEKAIEEKSALIKAKKQLEAENANLHRKIGQSSKDSSSEIGFIREKIQEIEMKYESLEACQDEMILNIRKLYKDWGEFNRLPLKRIPNTSDPTREAVAIIENIILDAKQLGSKGKNNFSEDLNEIIIKSKNLLVKIESQPDSIYRAHVLKLITENLQLKEELMEKHRKSLEDGKMLENLSGAEGINEWVMQKWKECEKDISRLREQLLQVTLELEKRIRLTKESPEDLALELDRAKAQIEKLQMLNTDFDYLNSSEKDYYNFCVNRSYPYTGRFESN